MMIGLDGLLNRFYFNQDFSAPDVTFRRGKWGLTYTYIGEGYNGDFTVKDPTDVPLYRADLSFRGKGCIDGSYCTSIPVDTSKFLLRKLADNLFDKLDKEHPALVGPDLAHKDIEEFDDEVSFNDRIMQGWTWETPQDAANGTMD